MAPLLFRGMKGVNLSCASPASTAICTSMDGQPVFRQNGRALDCQTPHPRDKRRMKALNSIPKSPSKLKSYHQKSRKSSAEKATDLISPASSSRYLLNDDDDFFDVYPDWDPIPDLINMGSARFQSVKGDDSPVLKPSSSARSQELVYSRASSSSLTRFHTTKGDESAVLKTLCTSESQDRIYFRSDSSPPSAMTVRFHTTKGDESAVLKPSSSDRSRDQIYFRASSSSSSSPSTRFESVKGHESVVLKPFSSDRSRDQVYFRASSSSSPSTRFQTIKGDESAVLKPPSSARSRDQVVVLRVSLHCKGCEGKVRKHISRMEGVTSFNIDFATKKVTVIGDVTPLGVLSSISKVKNAQFWPSPPQSSPVL